MGIRHIGRYTLTATASMQLVWEAFERPTQATAALAYGRGKGAPAG